MVYAVATGVRAGLLGDVTNIVLKSVVSDANLTEAFGANQARDQVVLLASGPPRRRAVRREPGPSVPR